MNDQIKEAADTLKFARHMINKHFIIPGEELSDCLERIDSTLEALSEIKAYKKQISELQSKLMTERRSNAKIAKRAEKEEEWISCEERLPELNQYCLLVDGVDQYLDIYKFHPKGYTGYSMDIFKSVNNSGDCQMEEVTHWMPLPIF